MWIKLHKGTDNKLILVRTEHISCVMENANNYSTTTRIYLMNYKDDSNCIYVRESIDEIFNVLKGE